MVGFVGMFSRLRMFLLFSLDTFLAERGGGNIDLTTAPAYKAPFISSLYYLALAKKSLSLYRSPNFFLVSRNYLSIFFLPRGNGMAAHSTVMCVYKNKPRVRGGGGERETR